MAAPENPSRRDVLRAAIGAGAFWATFSLSAETRAALEDILNTQEFHKEPLEATLHRVRAAVFDRPQEVFWAHIVRNGEEYAVNILERTQGSNRVWGIDLVKLYEDKRVERILLVHSHAARIYEMAPDIPKERVAAILRARSSDLPLIPSGLDIITHIAETLRLQDMGANAKMESLVVEPSGSWSYDVDIEHPKLRQVLFKRTDDPGPRYMMVRANPALHMFLGDAFFEQQVALLKKDPPSSEDIARFIRWAKEEWGVSFTYTKAPAPSS